jgi:phosphate uptake regulator
VVPTEHNLEARKIQFSGKSSYTLALPKKWVEELGLRPGNLVNVMRQNDSTLLIIPTGVKAGGLREEASIKVTKSDSRGSIVRKLISAYLLGYNSIHVSQGQGMLTSQLREAIKEAVRRYLIGTEVVADSSEGIILQVLLSFPELSVKNALRRMFRIASSMHEDAVASLGKIDKDVAQAVVKADDEVDRFGLYLIRQLNIAVQNDAILKEAGISSRRDCLDFRLIVKSVERVADHAGQIAEAVISLEKPPEERVLNELLKMSHFALSLFDESGLALFKEDYLAADSLIERGRSIGEMQESLVAKISSGAQSETNRVLPLIVEHLRRTAEYASDIAEVVLNMSIERVTST